MTTPTAPPSGWRIIQVGEIVPDNTPFLVWEFGCGPWRPRMYSDKHGLVGKPFPSYTGDWSPLAVPRDGPQNFTNRDEGGVV